MAAPVSLTTQEATRLLQQSIDRNERRYMGSLVKVVTIFAMATAAFGGALYGGLSNVDRYVPVRDLFKTLNLAALAALATTVFGVIMLNPFERLTQSFEDGPALVRELLARQPLSNEQLNRLLEIASDDPDLLNGLYAKMNADQKAIARTRFPQLV